MGVVITICHVSIMGNKQLGKDNDNHEKEDSSQLKKDDVVSKERQKDNESPIESEERKSEDKEAMEEETDPITLTIKLQPSVVTETKPKEKTVTLSQYPKTGLDAKLFIQQEFQIPVCLQKLSLQSLEISDKQSFNQLHLRDGDILTVNFTTQGNLHEIQAILDSMEVMIKVLESSSEEIKGTLTPSTENQLKNCLKPEKIEKLLYYFNPLTDQVAKMNHFYFVHNKGIELMLYLHHLLIDIPPEKHVIEMKFLEISVLRVFCDLSAIIGIRCLLLQYPSIIRQISKSILRATILPYNEMEPPTYQRHNIPIELFTMFKGIAVIANLAELKDYQLEIVNTPLLIEQMTSAMLSPFCSINGARTVIATFLSLSYSPTTHLKLSRAYIIEGVLAACKRFLQDYTMNPVEKIILKHFATLFFALVSASSSDCVAKDEFQQFLPNIVSFMHIFLHNTTYDEVHKAEEQAGYWWSTMKPFVHLVYFHYDKHTYSLLANQNQVLKDLYLTSVQAGIFSLQSMSLSDIYKDQLEKEELTDYLTCLPWYVPEVLREDAELLVQLVNMKIKPRPPKLVNIVKGYLASYCFTLEEIMSPLFIDTLYQCLSQ